MPDNWISENSYQKQKNIRIKNNKQKQRISEVLHIRNMQTKLNRIVFKSSAKILKCL